MSQAIVDGINKYVGKDDLIVGAGDFSFGGVQNIWNFRKQIECKNIYWTYGNHDHHILHNKELRVPYSELELYKSLVDPGYYPSHHNYDDKNTFLARPKHLFNEIDKELWLKINGNYYVVQHWPKRSWFNSQDGSILLYGHEHSQIEHIPWGMSIDIGMDNAYRLYGEYRPFSEEMIFEQLKDRSIYQHGHH
jgi:predicted phosphodiesterase